jgi:hypothetical protein
MAAVAVVARHIMGGVVGDVVAVLRREGCFDAVMAVF